MTRRTLRLISFVGLSFCLTLAAACSKSEESLTNAPHIASVAEIEQQLQHQIAEPPADVGATVIKSGYTDDPNSTSTIFQRKTSVISYKWRNFIVLVRQGKAAPEFSMQTAISRTDAIISSGSDGSEIALLPPVGKSPALAYRLVRDWLITVDVAASTSNAPATTEEVKSFIISLRF